VITDPEASISPELGVTVVVFEIVPLAPEYTVAETVYVKEDPAGISGLFGISGLLEKSIIGAFIAPALPRGLVSPQPSIPVGTDMVTPTPTVTPFPKTDPGKYERIQPARRAGKDSI